jgi:hypothetical protein
MLPASNTPRRTAVRSLVASGLALFGLSQALDAGAAKNARAAKKKNKTKQGPPGPPGPRGPQGPQGPAGTGPGTGTLSLVPGSQGELIEGTTSGVYVGTSQCPPELLPVARLLTYKIQLNEGATGTCYISSDGPAPPVSGPTGVGEWGVEATCTGEAEIDLSAVVAWCLKKT